MQVSPHFVAPSVSNAGVINATMGKVALASGETVTLDLYGDDLVEVAVPGNVADALVENSGSINANGGVVQITAAQAKDVVDNIINVSGIVDVSSVSTQGGKIVLSGGDAGKVQVQAFLMLPAQPAATSSLPASSCRREDNAVLDASGTNGGGTIHFGGDWQGQARATPTSEYAFVRQDAILNANAEENGDGGEVVVWSDKVTGFFGLITAKGGANSGNGGRVETSSKGSLQVYGIVDAAAPNGNAGEWLLDPDNLTVVNGAAGAPVDASASPNILAAGGATNSTVTNGTINSALSAGTSVTLRTGNGNTEEGDITVNSNAAIAKTGNSNAILRMESHDDININGDITATGNGLLNIILLAGFNESGNSDSGNNDVNFGNNVDINTNGGDLEVGADRDITGSASSSILTEGGRVYMVAGSGFNLPIANHTVNAPHHDSNVLYNGSIDTDGGQVYMNAGDDIRLGGTITTNGGAATFIARGTNNNVNDLGDVQFYSTGSLNTTRNGANNDGSVFIQAENFINDGFIVARDSTVTLGRSTLGDIDVGDDNGAAYNISQNELRRTIARNLIIGDTNTNNVTVDNVDMHSQVTSAQDNLPAAVAGLRKQRRQQPELHPDLVETTETQT
jgi:hypothetical protein